MMKRRWMGILFGTLGLAAACSSGASSTPAECMAQPGLFCNPSPFVVAAFAVSDACGAQKCPLDGSAPLGATTANLTPPAAGKVCLSGTVAPLGYAQLIFGFTVDNPDGTKILTTFNADEKGITQMSFSIDTPPAAGLIVQAAITTNLECPDSDLDCFNSGFTLMTAPASDIPVNITSSEPVVAPFVDFEQTPPRTVTEKFDTSKLNFVAFVVGPGDYNFCVDDFKLLDAAGNEVKP
jgi:hypothetical protein